MKVLEHSFLRDEFFVHLRIIGDFYTLSESHRSFENRNSLENSLYKCTFSDSIFPEKSDSFSSMERHITNIEEWLSPTDKYIFKMDDFFTRMVSEWKSKVNRIMIGRLRDSIDLFERTLSTLGETSTRTSTETIYERFFVLDMEHLLIIELHRSCIAFLFLIDIGTIISYIGLDSSTSEHFDHARTGRIEKCTIM